MPVTRLPALAACSALCATAAAGTINVGPGESIQAAIDAAGPGDEIEVAPGTYAELIDFGGKAITLRSSAGAEVTTIDGQGAGRTVSCTSAEGPGTVLEGFTITGGSEVAGGGMRVENGSPAVAACIFTGNTATYGAALYNLDSSPTLVGCTFVDNAATVRAGAIYNNNSSPVAGDCMFIRNQAGSGGAVYVSTGTPSFTNCVFAGNVASFGGALFNINASNPVLLNCALAGNEAGSGGAIFNNTGAPRLINCTLSGNSGSGGGLSTLFGGPSLVNCVLWANTPDQILADAAAVAYCCVQGGFAGTGNIDADPMLLGIPAPGLDGQWGTPDDDYGDLRLGPGSACADAGNNWGVPADAADRDGDGNTGELFPVDLAGGPRFAADRAGFDQGCGAPVVVDMGAYEAAGGPAEVLGADVTGDGVVDVLDLLALLNAWAAAVPPGACLLDLDMNGTIGVTDLLMVLSLWSAAGG